MAIAGFTAWQNFYVIVGSSAGALIGLQFVALSLIAGTQTGRGNPEAGQAFASPTIIHFSAVVGLAALFTAPWESINIAGILWGILGLGGVTYSVLVIWRMRSQTAYDPEFEDWLCHAVLPLVAYFDLAASAFAASSHLSEALFGAGAAALLLLFIGIHNAWDAVTYHVFVKDLNDPQR